MVQLSKNWNELIKPSKLLVDTNKPNLAVFTVDPLETGFALTIGNVLRRVLLSSLQGAAITSVKIDSVVHEFTSIKGVKEDVADMILNFKSVIVQIHASDLKRMTLNVVGPCIVTAGMIESGHDVTI